MNKELEHQKTLYSLNKIFDIAVHQGNVIVDIRTDYETVKSALERKEKLEKLLNILKKHNFCILEYCIYNTFTTYEELVEDNNRTFIKYELPTEEEFKLLKEMIKYGNC